jgi:transposase
MRGADITQEALFTTAKLDDFVPNDHPLRAIRQLTDQALRRMSGLFSTLYADTGRHSIAPEKLLRAQLLQLFYSLRSERMLMEQLRYNLLFRWFVGVAIDEAVWDHSVFSKNRDRLNDEAVASEFLQEIVRLATEQGLMSDEHFSVDGTLLQAWASQKSFRPKDGPPEGGTGGPRNAAPDFKGQKRKNDTHASTSDPDSRLFCKGNSGAQLSYQGHVLMEHRNGLVRGACVSRATGYGERESALKLLEQLPGRRRRTLAADKAYDTADFVAACRRAGVTPHVAQNTRARRSAIDARTTRHAGYALSLKTRAWIETHFGWIKSAGLRQVKQRGLARVEALFQFAMAASNLVRLPKLLAAGAAP